MGRKGTNKEVSSSRAGGREGVEGSRDGCRLLVIYYISPCILLWFVNHMKAYSAKIKREQLLGNGCVWDVWYPVE